MPDCLFNKHKRNNEWYDKLKHYNIDNQQYKSNSKYQVKINLKKNIGGVFHIKKSVFLRHQKRNASLAQLVRASDC